MVFVHGFVESWRYFVPLLRCLPPSLHALAPTQRGHRSVEGNPVGCRISDFASDIGTSPDGMSEELVSRLVEESLAIPAEVWRESFSGLVQAGRAQPLEEVHVPTLLLSGSSDTFVRDDQQLLLDRIPDAELVVHGGVGHGPHLARPERVAADIAAFVHRRVRAAPSSGTATTT